MAQIFKLNGITFSRVTRADWQDDSAGAGLDGTTARQRWVRHTWQAQEGLTAAEFDSLYALEGQRVALTTTNYSDRNGDFVTYRGASCMRVDGRHEANLVIGVMAEFMVRL